MSDRILHKRSFTTGSIPTTSSLLVGEIALNVPDGKVYIHKSGSEGQSIESAITSNSTTDIGTLTLSGSLILSGSPDINSGSVFDVAADNISFDFDSLSFSGSAEITGSLLVTDGITGSLQGTASFAQTASYVTPLNQIVDVTGEVNVNGIPLYEQSLQDAFTGVIKGGIITINPLNAQVFDISEGAGYIIDNYSNPENPTYTYVTWPNLSITASAFPGPGQPAIYPRTNIAINPNGTVFEKADKFTPQDYREKIVLGRAVHVNNTVITRTLALPLTTYNRGFHWFDLANSIGPINITGNIYSAGGSDMTLQKTSGQTYRVGTNYAIDPSTPDITTDGASSPTTFRYRYRSGSAFIETSPTTIVTGSLYDNGSGTLQIVNNNQWTVQRIFFFAATGTTITQFGQNIYNSKATAQQAALNEQFQVDPNLTEDAILRSYLILRGGATNLSNINDAEFLEAVAGSTGGGSGGTITSLESLSDVEYTTLLQNGQTIIRSGSIWVNGYPTSASFAQTSSFALSGNGIFTGSFTGSFIGDGSQLTGIAASKWSGSNPITRDSDVEITGSFRVEGQTTLSTTGSGTLKIQGSGSDQPLFLVSGSIGELISITDDDDTNAPLLVVSGSAGQLFVVENSTTGSLLQIYNTNSDSIFEVTDTAEIIYGISSSILTTQYTTIPATASYQTIYNIETGSFTGAFVNYTVASGSNARAGQLMSVWNAGTASYTETTTADIGDTSQIAFDVIMTGSIAQVAVSASATTDWQVKTILNIL